MNKHTPGPWAFYKSEQENGDICFDIFQQDGAPFTPHLSDVCYSRLFKTYTSEYKSIQESNARLIAAAPELLKALQDMGVRYGLTEIARAAIAKATQGENK